MRITLGNETLTDLHPKEWLWHHQLKPLDSVAMNEWILNWLLFAWKSMMQWPKNRKLQETGTAHQMLLKMHGHEKPSEMKKMQPVHI